MSAVTSLILALVVAAGPTKTPAPEKAPAPKKEAASEKAPAPKKETAPAAKKESAPAPVVEPEYVGIPYRLDKKKNELVSLERQTYAIHSKVKGLGFGGARASYEVPGRTSPIRFVAGEPLTIVIKLASKDSDPMSAMKLVPLTAAAPGKKQAKEGSGGVRQMVIVDQKNAFAQASIDPTLGALSILIKPYGDGCFQFKPETDLAPGEYAVILPASMLAYCFGVDSK